MFVSLKASKFNISPTLVNADCQNVILLDHCKNNLLFTAIEELRTRQKESYTMIKVCESKVKMINDAAASSDEIEETKTPVEATPESEELDEWKTYLEKITTALNTMDNSKMTVEFHDESGSSMNLSASPKEAAATTLSIRSPYVLMCNVPDQEPASVFDLCDVESPLERQKKEAVAAAKAAKAEEAAAAAAAAAAAQE